MYCKNCGKELNENASFCDACGQKQETTLDKTVDELRPIPIIDKNDPLIAKYMNQATAKIPNAKPYVNKLKCPICGEIHVQAVEETYRSLRFQALLNFLLRTTAILLILIGIIMAFDNASSELLLIGVIIFAINELLFFLFKMFIVTSRTKIICLECGHWYYLNLHK